jgi:type VI secretion system secreted protein VgrG
VQEYTRALAATVRVKDYDYAKPSLDVSSSADLSSLGSGDVVMFSGRFFTPSDAKRLAGLRAEGHKATEHVIRASGVVYGMRAGYTFELERHPRDDLNQKYLVTAARHEGLQHGASPELLAMARCSFEFGYRVQVTAIPASVQFRKSVEAAWPMVRGFEHGTIDGAADSEYAQIDDQGRYNVKLHFDESDLSGGKASTRIRMMQPHAGNPEGFHFPLRKGSEVVVGFLGGDPDRPFIAGFVPNAENPSPVTQSNYTQNVVQTGGKNRIEIEDKAGQQYIDISTPPKETYLHLGQPHGKHSHYITAHTAGDCLFEIGGTQDIDVGGKLTEKVTGTVNETYSTSQTSTIDGLQKTTVNQPVYEFYGATQHTKVTGLRSETFTAGELTIVGGARTEEYHVGRDWTVFGGDMTEIYSGGLTRMVTGSTSELYVDALDVTATGAVTLIYPSGVTQKYGPTDATWKSLTWLAGDISINAPNWTIITPDHFQWFGGWKDVRWIKHQEELLNTSTTVLKIERAVASIAAAGVKVDVNGAKLGLIGHGVEVGGAKIEVGIAKIKATGIKKYL